MSQSIVARAALAIFLTAPVALNAAEIPGLSAPYGNEAGCRFAASGAYNDDTLILLRPDQFLTFVTICRFVQALPVGDGSHIVTALCGNEGEAEQSIQHIRIAKEGTGADAYEVFGASGELWGRVDRCR